MIKESDGDVDCEARKIRRTFSQQRCEIDDLDRGRQGWQFDLESDPSTMTAVYACDPRRDTKLAGVDEILELGLLKTLIARVPLRMSPAAVAIQLKKLCSYIYLPRLILLFCLPRLFSGRAVSLLSSLTSFPARF
jgi:hypothetical protein